MSTNIYDTSVTPEVKLAPIKRYKIKRLGYVNNKSFWPIWKQPTSYFSNAYSLATSMSLARFNDKEILGMLIGWHHKHDYKVDYRALYFIIAEVNKFTLPTRREHKRIENLAYRKKQKLKKAVAKQEASK